MNCIDISLGSHVSPQDGTSLLIVFASVEARMHVDGIMFHIDSVIDPLRCRSSNFSLLKLDQN